MKKILITILIALAALPSVYAQQVSVRIENLTYIINTDDHTAVLNKGQNTVGYLTIPKTITESGQEYTITSIADNAFEQQTQLKEVTILADITSIGDYAFSGCTELENISLPNSLISIGNGAFYECKTIEHISLPANLTDNTARRDSSSQKCDETMRKPYLYYFFAIHRNHRRSGNATMLFVNPIGVTHNSNINRQRGFLGLPDSKRINYRREC